MKNESLEDDILKLATQRELQRQTALAAAMRLIKYLVMREGGVLRVSESDMMMTIENCELSVTQDHENEDIVVLTTTSSAQDDVIKVFDYTDTPTAVLALQEKKNSIPN